MVILTETATGGELNSWIEVSAAVTPMEVEIGKEKRYSAGALVEAIPTVEGIGERSELSGSSTKANPAFKSGMTFASVDSVMREEYLVSVKMKLSTLKEFEFMSDLASRTLVE